MIRYTVSLPDELRDPDVSANLATWEAADGWHASVTWWDGNVWPFGPCATAAEAIGRALIRWYCELAGGDVAHNDVNLITLE